MLFEAAHSARTDFCILRGPAPTSGFPLHLHETLECYLVTRGRVLVTVDEHRYDLGAGEGVLVFPYQRHSYEAQGEAESFYCLFSADFASAYTQSKAKLLPEDPCFSFPLSRLPVRSGRLSEKAFVYEMLSLFDEGRRYLPRSLDAQNALLSRILIYLSEHLAEDCSLRAVAAHVGYEYAYLSKYFKRATGLSLHTYVSALRVSRAKTLLAESDLPVRLVAERCGFPCLRSFNRVFHAQVTVTPSEYRAGLRLG